MMKKEPVAFICGLLFSLGLVISQMVNPTKVINFLDFFGHWDPTLAFVLAGATRTIALLRPWIMKRERPLFDEQFRPPERFDHPLAFFHRLG